MIEVVPVTAKVVTVLGYEVTARSPMWRGLRLDQAIAYDPPHAQLNAPWHPPGKSGEPEVHYRVRPRAKPGERWKGRAVRDARFVKGADGAWMMEIRYAD